MAILDNVRAVQFINLDTFISSILIKYLKKIDERSLLEIQRRCSTILKADYSHGVHEIYIDYQAYTSKGWCSVI